MIWISAEDVILIHSRVIEGSGRFAIETVDFYKSTVFYYANPQSKQPSFRIE